MLEGAGSTDGVCMCGYLQEVAAAELTRVLNRCRSTIGRWQESEESRQRVKSHDGAKRQITRTTEEEK